MPESKCRTSEIHDGQSQVRGTPKCWEASSSKSSIWGGSCDASALGRLMGKGLVACQLLRMEANVETLLASVAWSQVSQSKT
jgi:hypothetical protein